MGIVIFYQPFLSLILIMRLVSPYNTIAQLCKKVMRRQKSPKKKYFSFRQNLFFNNTRNVERTV